MSSSNTPSSGSGPHRNRDRRLNILHIDPEKAWGGGEVQVTELTTHLLRSGHHSVVAADPRGVLYTRLSEAGLPVIPLRIRNHFDPVAGFLLRRLARRGGYDVVHFHTARAHALSPWLHGLSLKRLVTRRMDYPLRTGFMTRLLYLHSVDMVIAISLGVHAALTAAGVPQARIRLIASGIDTARFAPTPAVRGRMRAQYGIASHTPLVVSVGALVERKGHSLLLSAARRLKEQGYNIQYLISGNGPLRHDLEGQAQALGLAREVRFLGFCRDIPGLLAAADYFVHIPRQEGLGVAVMEALAAGAPTIASRVGGIPELIEDGKTGVLIPPRDDGALATALIRLLDNPQFARRLGMAGQALVRTRFDVNVMARTNETLYVELLTDTA